MKLEPIRSLYERPTELSQVAKHPHAGCVTICLPVELTERCGALRFSIDQVADPLRFACRLAVKKLTGDAEEAFLGETFEIGLQRYDHER